VAFALPTAPVAAPATPDAMPVDAAAKEPVDA
jgi:hypothetical protein